MAFIERDAFCWVCHEETIQIYCKKCPRVYHCKCIDKFIMTDDWCCIECEAIAKSLTAEVSIDSHLLQLTLHELSQLLEIIVNSIREIAHPLLRMPLDASKMHKNITHPMDIYTIDKNNQNHVYRSAQSFLSDIKWIRHNCKISEVPYHIYHSASNIVSYAEEQIKCIDQCSDCYRNWFASTDYNAFTEPCKRPHSLIFAKLRGYPFWPAKVIRYTPNGGVYCQFFGDHTFANVWINKCFLISEKTPKESDLKLSKKRGDVSIIKIHKKAMRELREHIKRLNNRFPGKFKYYPIGTGFGRNKLFICDDIPLIPRENREDCDETKPNLSLVKTEIITIKSEPSDDSEFTSYDNEFPVENSINDETMINNTILNDEQNPRETNHVPGNSMNKRKRLSTETSESNESFHTRISRTAELIKENEMLRMEMNKQKDQLSLLNDENVKVHDKVQQLESEIQKLNAEKETERIIGENRYKELHGQLWASIEYEKGVLLKEIADNKRKQWCSVCRIEASVFCCYNTWYCTVQCQNLHLKMHFHHCRNKVYSSTSSLDIQK